VVESSSRVGATLLPTLQVQASLKSNGDMDLIPIGQAASRLGMRTSVLRYYDERGLVCPSARLAGWRRRF
jgi:MerR family regulatory protein